MTHRDFSSISCGVHQLSGLYGCYSYLHDNPQSCLNICSHLLERRAFEKAGNGSWLKDVDCAFILFSDATLNNNGVGLAKFIRDKGLGELTETPEALNPNSNNRIQVWVWKVDWAKVRSVAPANPIVTAVQKIAAAVLPERS